MNPIAISFLGLSITWYAIFIVSGMALGTAVAKSQISKHDIEQNIFYDYVFYLIIWAIIGARLWYVIFDLKLYVDNPLSIFAIYNGGLAIHGGISAGVLYTLYFCRKQNIKFLLMTDLAVGALIIGQVIGRFGNFVNQEAHGGATTYEFLHNTLHLPLFIVNGMYIDGVYYQPTFLYEAVWNLIGFLIIIFILRPRWQFSYGRITAFYLMWYGFIRTIIEQMRTDALLAGGIKVAQVASIIMFVTGLAMFIYFYISSKKEKNA